MAKISNIKNKIHQYNLPGVSKDLLPDKFFPAILEFDVENISPPQANALRRIILETPVWEVYLTNYLPTDPYVLPERLVYQLPTLPIDQNKEYDSDLTFTLTGDGEYLLARDIKPYCPFNSNVRILEFIEPPRAGQKASLSFKVRKTKRMEKGTSIVTQIGMRYLSSEEKIKSGERIDVHYTIHYVSAIKHMDILRNAIKYMLELLESLGQVKPDVFTKRDEKYIWSLGKKYEYTVAILLSDFIYEADKKIPFEAPMFDYSTKIPQINIRYHSGVENLSALVEKARNNAIAEWRKMLDSLK